MTPVARHRWIEVAPAGHGDVASSADAAQREAVLQWLRDGLPLVARSRASDDPPGAQPAGLSLAVPAGKVRIALRVPHRHIARVEEPPALAAVASILATDASGAVGELAARAVALGFTAHVFGSAAWQWRTGRRYLHAGSDLDVLAAPPTAAATRAWIECLRAIEPQLPMRVDGEIESASGDAVNWRELAGPAARVLVKSVAGARLAERAVLERAWR